MSERVHHRSPSERGAAGLIFIMFLGVALAIGALAIDLGEGLVAKAELANATDAATLAATRELAKVYAGQPTRNLSTWTLTGAEQDRIVQKAIRFAALNGANGSAVAVRPEDVVIGRFDRATGAITPTTTGARAVSVRAHLDGVANGAIPTLLARAIGAAALRAHASSTAGLLALGEAPAATLNLPVGISSAWFQSNSCGPTTKITFSPTGSASSCSGWHTYTETPSTVPKLQAIACGLSGSAACAPFRAPAATAGSTTFQFVGNPYNATTSAVSQIQALYKAKMDPTGGWRVMVPVYEDSTCATPVGPKKVIGFATVLLYSVNTATATISAYVQCGIADYGKGDAGTDFGTFSGSPRVLG